MVKELFRSDPTWRGCMGCVKMWRSGKKCPNFRRVATPNRLCGDMLWARPIDQMWWSGGRNLAPECPEKSLSIRGLESTDRLCTEPNSAPVAMTRLCGFGLVWVARKDAGLRRWFGVCSILVFRVASAARRAVQGRSAGDLHTKWCSESIWTAPLAHPALGVSSLPGLQLLTRVHDPSDDRRQALRMLMHPHAIAVHFVGPISLISRGRGASGDTGPRRETTGHGKPRNNTAGSTRGRVRDRRDGANRASTL